MQKLGQNKGKLRVDFKHRKYCMTERQEPEGDLTNFQLLIAITVYLAPLYWFLLFFIFGFEAVNQSEKNNGFSPNCSET